MMGGKLVEVTVKSIKFTKIPDQNVKFASKSTRSLEICALEFFTVVTRIVKFALRLAFRPANSNSKSSARSVQQLYTNLLSLPTS